MGTDAGRGKERKKRVRDEAANLESRDTRRAKQIKPNVVTGKNITLLILRTVCIF